MSDQTDDAASQVLALQQHENHKRDHESRCRKWSDGGTEPARKIGQSGHLLRLDNHRFARIPEGRLGARGLFLDLLDRFLDLLH